MGLLLFRMLKSFENGNISLSSCNCRIFNVLNFVGILTKMSFLHNPKCCNILQSGSGGYFS